MTTRGTTRVSERGQVTIPKQIRDRLGIRPGQVLVMREEGGRIVVVKAATRDPVDDVYGILDLGECTDRLLEEIRGPAEAG